MPIDYPDPKDPQDVALQKAIAKARKNKDARALRMFGERAAIRAEMKRPNTGWAIRVISRMDAENIERELKESKGKGLMEHTSKMVRKSRLRVK